MDITNRFERFISGSSPEEDAMEIIKKGNYQNNWSADVECSGWGNGGGGCGAILRISLDDLYKTYSKAPKGTTTYITFPCCECGVKTDLKDFPSHLWNQVRNKE